MTRARQLMAAAAIVLIGTWPVSASAQVAEDPHHPAGATAQATPQAPTAPAAAGQPGIMGGQGMMGGMSMMNMMGMMQMMGGGDAPGMAMIDRVEGRIAFLRTEIKITEAQTGAWNAFAAALRTNAQHLGAVRGAMMGQMTGQPQTQTLGQRLDAQERWLSARLEGTRAMKTAFTGLYNALSDEQKKTADELLAPHLGMGMGPMGMMSMMRSTQ